MTPAATAENTSHRIAPAGAPAKAIPFAVNYSPTWARVLFGVDLTFFVASAYLANLLAEYVWHTPPPAKQVVGAIIIIALWIVMFRTLGLYHRTYAFRVKDEIYYTVAALCLGALPQLVIFTIVPAISTSRVGALLSLAFSVVMVSAGRAIMHGVRSLRMFRRSSRLAIVGTPDRMQNALSSLEGNLEFSPLLVEIDDVNATLASGDGRGIESVPWFAQALSSHCGTLVLTEMIDPHLLPHVVDVATKYRMRVAFAPPRIKRHSYSLSLETNGNQTLIVASQLNACTPAARLRKRVLDLILGTAGLILFAPLMLVCAVAVFLDSGLPVLYRQERVGLGGKPFIILKFRSMRNDAESQTGAIWVRENDDRRTRIGAILRRLSFDELPQLFNVLRGDMSLVGPRPERPVFVEQFRMQFPRYDERFFVPPGITGWSHVHMHRLVSPGDIAERLEYDLRYVEQWTVWLDVSILFKTTLEVLFHRSG